MPGHVPLLTGRLGALDRLGWTFVAAGLVSFAVAARELAVLVQGGAVSPAAVVLFGSFGGLCLWIAHAIAQPEVDTRCRECGTRLVVDSARNGVDAAVTVQFADAPTRGGLGPVSYVRSRDRTRYQYCSPLCARVDLGALRETQPAVSRDGHDTAAPMEEVAS